MIKNRIRVFNKDEAIRANVDPDSYESRIIKYIPVETVSFYTGARALLLPDTNGDERINDELSIIDKKLEIIYGDLNNTKLYLTIFFVGLLGTVISRYLLTRDPKLKIPLLQICISVIAFCLWVFAFGDIFHICLKEKYSHQLAGILLLSFTFMVPLIVQLYENSKTLKD